MGIKIGFTITILSLMNLIYISLGGIINGAFMSGQFTGGVIIYLFEKFALGENDDGK